MRAGGLLQIGAVRVSLEDAKTFLLDGYNPRTVLYYDFGGDTSVDSPAPSAGAISFADLGRVVCVGGGLTYRRGHELMECSREIAVPRLATAGLEQILDPGRRFVEHPDVLAIVDVFADLAARVGIGWGTAGKILHLKYPAHLPIPDSSFRAVYRSRAIDFHESYLRDSRERRTPRTVGFGAYFGAFHSDLVAGLDVLIGLRNAFRERAMQSVEQAAHRRRLAGLSLTRILDALAWGVGRGDLATSNG